MLNVSCVKGERVIDIGTFRRSVSFIEAAVGECKHGAPYVEARTAPVVAVSPGERKGFSVSGTRTDSWTRSELLRVPRVRALPHFCSQEATRPLWPLQHDRKQWKMCPKLDREKLKKKKEKKKEIRMPSAKKMFVWKHRPCVTDESGWFEGLET